MADWSIDLNLVLTLLAIFLLLLLSGFFSGSETALTGASRARIHRLSKTGDRRARRVEKLIEDRESLIGGILLGNNLVNILASSLATSVLLRMVGEAGVVYATLIMTALVLIFAEVLPKTYALSDPDRMALRVGRPIKAIVRLFSPIVGLVRRIVWVTLRLFGVRLSGDGMSAGHEEIRGAIDLSVTEGAIRKSHRDMLGSILDLDDLTVEDVMIHRRSMAMLDVNQPIEKLINRVIRSPYTRLPLYDQDQDNIVGILHAKDVLRAVRRATAMGTRDMEIRQIMNEPWFVPETTTLREQLNAFRDKRQHVALVVDEYGSLMGLVTLEDILEEIVGPISDEFDSMVEGVQPQDDGSILVDGAVTIRDLNREFDWQLPDEDAATIAGLLIYEAETIPVVGNKYSLFGFDFEVMGRRHNQITQIKMRKSG